MKRSLKNISICVVRINSANLLKDSTPCEDCTKILNRFKIKKLIHIDKNGDIITKKNNDNLQGIKSKARTKYTN